MCACVHACVRACMHVCEVQRGTLCVCACACTLCVWIGVCSCLGLVSVFFTHTQCVITVIEPYFRSHVFTFVSVDGDRISVDEDTMSVQLPINAGKAWGELKTPFENISWPKSFFRTRLVNIVYMMHTER